MNVYLSYRHGVDVSMIKQLIASYNMDCFDSVDEDFIVTSLQQSIKNAIEKCDCVIFVFTEESSHMPFEAGVAVALSKPIFSILANGGDAHYLFDSTNVKASITEVDKIKFSLDLFLQHIAKQHVKPSSYTIVSKTAMFYGGGEGIPFSVDYSIRGSYNRALEDKNPGALESFFAETFAKYEVSIVKSPLEDIPKTSWVPDFSIWVDELWSILGNPIMVEVKSVINREALRKIKETIVDMRSSNPSNGLLVFYNRLDHVQENELLQNSNCLFISIEQLVSHLERSRFPTAIKKIRNQIFHKQ